MPEEEKKKEYINIFAEGAGFKPPKEGIPSFIKGHLSFKVETFIAFLKKYENKEGWVNVDMKKSKKGGIYLALNTYGMEKGKGGSDAKEVEDVKDEEF